jgi:adenylyltransferase/sulfurtransferase
VNQEASGRYARQVLFAPLGEAGQEQLRSAEVLIVGCGALGSHAAEYLARAGVGLLRLVDRDVVEWTNLHRQLGYTEKDAREKTPKALALQRHLREINSNVRAEAHVADFNFTNAEQLARDSALLLDGTDNLPTRFLINDVSYSRRVPWIYAGAVGSSSHVQFFSGSEGPCLRCLLPQLPPPGTLATCDTAGVIAPSVGMAASWQSALALRYLVEREPAALARRKVMADVWEGEARVAAVAADPDCTVCVQRRFDSLQGASGERVTELCGRNAVQVLPARNDTSVDLRQLADRLATLGVVEQRPALLRVRTPEGLTATVFTDGRVIFDGLTDTAQARSLYARFVGQ